MESWNEASVGIQKSDWRNKKKDGECTYKSNTEALTRKHCWCGKAVSITYSECVPVTLNIQQEMRMRLIAICCLPGSTIFFSYYLINGTIFGKRWLNIKCAFSYLRYFSEKFLILKGIRWDITINVRMSSCKILIILVRF